MNNPQYRLQVSYRSPSPEIHNTIITSASNLDLETTGTSASTGLLEFASLRLDIWLLLVGGSVHVQYIPK